jgi:hypothetical protein
LRVQDPYRYARASVKYVMSAQIFPAAARSGTFFARAVALSSRHTRYGTSSLSAHENAVTRWFGTHFDDLHPLLRELHRRGGTLHGDVDIQFGTGVAGWLGRRMARRIGIPTCSARMPFEVRISHTHDALQWDRRFGADQWMESTFTPRGTWPDGCWIECTGAVTLRLRIEVIDGGWYWRCVGARLGRMPLPLWLLPTTRAYKAVRAGKYVFHVGLALPALGKLLSYEGVLDAAPAQG